MKQALRINLSGLVFNIDEDAYHKLNSYLDAVYNRFSNTEEGNEIIIDVEARIAELFQEKINSGKQVIVMVDVDKVISIMGLPEDFATEEEQAEETENNNSEYTYQEQEPIYEKQKHRRFFRDPESRIIGGVCSGLAHYFGTSPIFVRIFFVLVTFLYGSSVVAYLLLWLILPEAKSTSQKLEMKGENINLSNIEKTIREEVEKIKNEFNGYDHKKTNQKVQGFFHSVFRAIGSIIQFFLRIVKGIVGTGLLLFGISGITAIIAFVVLADTNWANNDLTSAISFFELMVDKPTLLLSKIALVLVITMPLIMVTYIGIKFIVRFRSNNKLIGIGALIFWIVGVALSVIVGVKESENFRRVSFFEKTKEIKTSQNTLYLSVKNYDEIEGQYLDFGKWKGVFNKNTAEISIIPRIDIRKSSSDNFEIIIKKQARGISRKDANYKAQQLEYKWQIKDSTLIFDEFAFLKKTNRFSAQNIKIILKVPEGKKVYMKKSMLNLIYDIKNVQNMHDRYMTEKIWKMSPKGLTYIK